MECPAKIIKGICTGTEYEWRREKPEITE